MSCAALGFLNVEVDNYMIEASTVLYFKNITYFQHTT